MNRTEPFSRATLLLGILLVTALPGGGMALAGLLPSSAGALLWVALFVPSLASAILMLTAVHYAARGADSLRTRPRTVAVAAGVMFCWLSLVLALPILVFPALPPHTLRILEKDPGVLEELRRRALTHADPAVRVQAAWELFLATGREPVYLTGEGDASLYSPNDRDRYHRAVYRWVASRPGAKLSERRWLAAADGALIVVTVAALPLAAWSGRRLRPRPERAAC